MSDHHVPRGIAPLSVLQQDQELDNLLKKKNIKNSQRAAGNIRDVVSEHPGGEQDYSIPQPATSFPQGPGEPYAAPILVELEFPEWGGLKLRLECTDIARTAVKQPQLILLFRLTAIQLPTVEEKKVIVKFQGEEHNGVVYGGPFLFSRDNSLYALHIYLSDGEERESGSGIPESS